jgi:hypothetical protein
LWLLLGGGGVLALLCCGCGGLVFFSLNFMEESFKKELANDPVVQEHVGEVESVDWDFVKSAEEADGKGGPAPMVLHVKGSKGEADVIGEQAGSDEEGNLKLRNGVLRLPSGEEFKLSE